jgi:hypothetical protein
MWKNRTNPAIVKPKHVLIVFARYLLNTGLDEDAVAHYPQGWETMSKKEATKELYPALLCKYPTVLHDPPSVYEAMKTAQSHPGGFIGAAADMSHAKAAKEVTKKANNKLTTEKLRRAVDKIIH